MRIRPFIVSALCVAGALCAASAAMAGYYQNSLVTVWGGGFQGNVSAARYSADGNQYIGCTTMGSTSGAPWMSCFATDANNNHTGCITSNANLIEVASRLNSSSFLWVEYDSQGYCSNMDVQDASWGLR
jgi:hypothetical protein